MTLSGRSRYLEVAGSALRDTTWRSLLLAAWRSVGRYGFGLYCSLRLSRSVSSSVTGDELTIGADASRHGYQHPSGHKHRGITRRHNFHLLYSWYFLATPPDRRCWIETQIRWNG